MAKLAFVFSGQGSQYPGMGREICDNVPAAAEVFSRADSLRPGTSAQCFGGTVEELALTVNTQPCLFAMETAVAAALAKRGIKADMAAGFSLGELAALCYAGASDQDSMFGLVMKRAGFMQTSSEKHPASMAAVLKLDADTLKGICSKFGHVYPVNYNCRGNISVSGDEEEMGPFMEAVKAAGGRAVLLKVKGGFHSPFMEEAAESFAGVLEEAKLKAPGIPVYANKTGRPYPSDEVSIKEILASQIRSPVLWEDSVKAMIGDGADTFVEIGPGETLSGMIRRVSRDVRVYAVSDMESLEKLSGEI